MKNKILSEKDISNYLRQKVGRKGKRPLEEEHITDEVTESSLSLSLALSSFQNNEIFQ